MEGFEAGKAPLCLTSMLTEPLGARVAVRGKALTKGSLQRTCEEDYMHTETVAFEL